MATNNKTFEHPPSKINTSQKLLPICSTLIVQTTRITTIATATVATIATATVTVAAKVFAAIAKPVIVITELVAIKTKNLSKKCCFPKSSELLGTVNSNELSILLSFPRISTLKKISQNKEIKTLPLYS